MAEVGLPSPARLVGLKSLDLPCLKTEMEKWNLSDIGRKLGFLVLYIIAWLGRVALVFLPQRVPLNGLSSALVSFTHDIPSAPPVNEDDQASGAIGRALTQVLALVNDLPASSGKYTFARDFADKIIRENAAHGHGYESVNRAALSAGFRRTLTILNWSLEGRRHQTTVDLWSWFMKIMRTLQTPLAGLKVVLPPSLSLLLSQIGSVFPSFSSTKQVSLSTRSSSAVNTEMSEKLAQELLWLAEKLARVSALEEGLAQWSSASSLASLALVASPGVQRALVRLSALFAKELVYDTDVPRDVRFNMLRLWIPLFCTATHGGDGPIFTTCDKMEVEITLGKAIGALPQADQEIILAIWLQEFALCTSDWPNLLTYYDVWCNTTQLTLHGEYL